MNKLHKNHMQTLMVALLAINIALLTIVIMTLSAVIGLSNVVYAQQTQEKQPSFVQVGQAVEPEQVIVPEENIEVKSEVVETFAPTDERKIINDYVNEICSKPAYSNVDPALVKSVIQHESEYTPKHKTGDHIGLMQISTRWHSDRAVKLGVTDFFDPYSNILLGVDYLSELLKRYEDPALALMMYSMDNNKALALYREGKITNYAESVLTLADEYRKGE